MDYFFDIINFTQLNESGNINNVTNNISEILHKVSRLLKHLLQVTLS